MSNKNDDFDMLGMFIGFFGPLIVMMIFAMAISGKSCFVHVNTPSQTLSK